MPKPDKGNGGGDNGTINGNKRDNILNGTAASDIIDGKAGDDVLFGFGGDDTLLGGTGNDTLEAGQGNDSVDGGSGTDFAVFSGNRDDYAVTDLGGGLIEVSGPDGTDSFSNIEFFRFSDMTQSMSEVVLPRLANLSVDTLSVDSTVLSAGETTSAFFELASDGKIDAEATSYELLVASAPDEGSVLSVIDSQTAGAIQTGDTQVLTTTIAADLLAPGTYWIAVRVDASDALEEENEADNITEWVQITVDPAISDFRLSSSIDPASDFDLGNDARILIDYTLENASNGGSGGYRIVSFLSQDGTISADDIQIAETSGTLSSGQSSVGTLDATLESEIPDGDWQVLTTVEWTGGETEISPDDNTSANAMTLAPAIADLRLASATLGPGTDLDLSGGGRLQMTYGIEDVGSDTPSYLKITTYLSTDNQISADDKSVLGITGGTFPGMSIAPTTSHYFQDDFAAGDYYLISEISWGDGTTDATPADNVIVQQITFAGPSSDLAINDVSLDETSDLLIDADGITLRYDVDVSNLGSVVATSGLTAYLSTDDSVSPDDIQIPSGTVALSAGSNELISVTAQLDGTMAGGNYQLIVMFDTPDDNAQNNLFQVNVVLEEPGAAPVITGTEGADTLTGTAGDDVIEALGGDDVIIATTGIDVTDGGDGTDLIDFSGLSSGVQLFADYSGDQSTFYLEDPTNFEFEQTFSNFEAISGTNFDDMVSLYDTSVRSLDLGGGNDIAEGSMQNDIIDGGAGDDMIHGLDGDDLITLGEGADLVAFNRTRFDELIIGSGNDTVTDFNVLEDLILFQIEYGTEYDPLADTTQTDDGALISYADGSSVLLQNVDTADLTEANFIFEDPFFL